MTVTEAQWHKEKVLERDPGRHRVAERDRVADTGHNTNTAWWCVGATDAA